MNRIFRWAIFQLDAGRVRGKSILFLRTRNLVDPLDAKKALRISKRLPFIISQLSNPSRALDSKAPEVSTRVETLFRKTTRDPSGFRPPADCLHALDLPARARYHLKDFRD